MHNSISAAQMANLWQPDQGIVPNMEGQASQVGATKSPQHCQLPGLPLAALGWEEDIVSEEKARSVPEPIWPELGWAWGPEEPLARRCLSSCQLLPWGAGETG